MSLFFIQTSFIEINEEKSRLNHISIEHWLEHDLFSLNWWILFSATIIPYFVWWILVDKYRLFEIFSYGLLCACTSMLLDVIGTEMLLWAYPDKLLPWIPPLIPADFVIIPITSMLVYQYCRSWKSFMLANLGWATLFSYIIEPLFVMRGMFYLGHHWRHTYSLIGFFILGMLLKGLFELIKRKLPCEKY